MDLLGDDVIPPGPIVSNVSAGISSGGIIDLLGGDDQPAAVTTPSYV